MKVLFAVNNDDISNAIVKKYQKEYKEILSYKSVYYFNAILKELQRDKTYDRVVISEDLEPFANNNYDAIDKFLFDKLDNISDEAINEKGKDTDIILICTDRRTKNDDILVKLFGIGIYNAIVGQDRSIDEVCKLINRPRTKKSAKMYYNIDAEDVNYQHENEDSVSETEVKNILAHYKRLGRNEEKYIESFDYIVSQYNDNQLKIIIRYLPIGVKAVLEEKSPKYQELVSSGGVDLASPSMNNYDNNSKPQEQEAIKVRMLENESEKSNIKGKIVIPSRINKSGVKKLIKKQEPVEENNFLDDLYTEEEDDFDTNEEEIGVNLMDELDELDEVNETAGGLNNGIDEINDTDDISDGFNMLDVLDQLDEDDEDEEEIEETSNEINSIEEIPDETPMVVAPAEAPIETPIEAPVEPMVEEKRGRGRPRKIVPVEEQDQNKPKRGRGRPKKVVPVPLDEIDAEVEDVNAIENDNVNDEEDEGLDLFNLDEMNVDATENNQSNQESEDVDLFNLVGDNDAEAEEDDDEEIDLFNLGDDNDDSDSIANDSLQSGMQEQDEEDEDDIDLFNLDGDDEEELEDNPVVNNNVQPSVKQQVPAADDDEGIDLFNLDDEDEEDDKDDIGFNIKPDNQLEQTKYQPKANDFDSAAISKDKKVVSFVGTTKNGTSFIVNNVAHLLASRGIKTAVLDMTKSRNAYYIYTNSEQKLMDIAKDCIYKLRSGVAEGIEINKNLSIYTSVPEDNSDYSDVKSIIETLVKNYSVVLIDADFDTPASYFDASQEIYLVQSMDVLTMQPLTAFLRNLQSKGVLKEEKLRVVINKSVNIKSVSVKVLIGGISKYNDPSMTFMKDLFNKDTIKYCQIPFELPNYIKYLDSVITCKINLNGYTGGFISALNELGNMIYPVINNTGTFTPRGNNGFSDEMNDTLNKMKKYQ